MSQAEQTMNPWLHVWIKPRQTIRAVVHGEVKSRFWLLCFLNGIFTGLSLMQVLPQTAYAPLLMIGAVCLIALPLGYLHFTVGSFFIFLPGKLIRGKAAFKEVRVALLWASVPGLVAGALIWGVRLGWAQEPFSLEPVGQAPFFRLVEFTVKGLLVWGFILALHAIGEVQRFSAWMALLNVFLILVGIILIVSLITFFHLHFLTDREGDHGQVHQTTYVEVVSAPCGRFLL